MVSTRRQINNEKDRFGGYSSRTLTQDNQISHDIFLPEQNETLTDDDLFLPDNDIQDDLVGQSFYSDHPDNSNFAYKPVSVVKPRRAEREELMPSIKTRQLLAQEHESKPVKKVQDKPKARIDVKTKTMLLVYIIAAVIMAVVVLGTGIAIGSVTNEVDSLQSQVEVKTQILNAKLLESADLENEANIMYEAVQNGMLSPNSSINIKLIPLSPTVQIEQRTNTFDKICDWFSKIFN